MQESTNSSAVTQPRNDNANKWHRAKAAQRRLNEIDPENDIRVRLLCKVIDKTVSGVIVEDLPAVPQTAVPTPQMEVELEQDLLAALKPDDVIRIFARVLPLESGFALRGELVQDMSQLDMELYKRVFKTSE